MAGRDVSVRCASVDAHVSGVRRIRKVPLIVAGILVTLFAVLFVYASTMPPPSSVLGPVDPIRFMAAEESDIRASMADPESVKFRNEFVSKFRRMPVV